MTSQILKNQLTEKMLKRDFLRYSFRSGQQSIHGMTNFRVKLKKVNHLLFINQLVLVQNQKNRSGRAILSTLGLYEEDLGNGLDLENLQLLIVYQRNKLIVKEATLF